MDLSHLGALFINLVNGTLVPVIFALAFIVFLWGAFQTFIWGANSEEAKAKGQNLMLYGLIGFVVMVSIWGLVNLITSSVPLNNQPPVVPSGSVTPAGQ